MKNYFQRLKERLKWDLKNLHKNFMSIIVLLVIFSRRSKDEIANREEGTLKNNNIEITAEEIEINTIYIFI